MLPCIMYTEEEFEVLMQKYPELKKELKDKKDPHPVNCSADKAVNA